MRLKVLTTSLLIAGLLLMLAWPVAMGGKPGHEASRRAKAEWGQRVIVYFAVTSGVWLMTATSALFLVRQSRKEFLEQERENLKALIEGTLKDHGRNP